MTVQHFPEQNQIVITRKAKFKSKLHPMDVKNLHALLVSVLTDEVSSKLFEGVEKLYADTWSLEIGFVFSLTDDNLERLRLILGHKEFGDIWNNYVLYVFAKVDQTYPIEDDLSYGFREMLNMTEYIK